jgi:hypothetical protein
LNRIKFNFFYENISINKIGLKYFQKSLELKFFLVTGNGRDAGSSDGQDGIVAQAPMPMNFNPGANYGRQGFQGINLPDYRHHIPTAIAGHGRLHHGTQQQPYPIVDNRGKGCMPKS